MPKVVGAIDGTHIHIKAPKEDTISYVNRKKYTSIILQGVCDSGMNFIDCLVGWPGSVHDAKVLQNSEVYSNVLQNGKDYLFGAEGYLLGDAAYPLKEWLMTPFKNFGQLTQEQKVYNEAHSSTRCIIERAFALLKGRFRKLKYMDVEILEDILLFIMASCILHNICLWREEDIHDMMEEGQNHVNSANDGDGLPGQLEEYGDAAAIRKRLYLVDVVQQ